MHAGRRRFSSQKILQSHWEKNVLTIIASLSRDLPKDQKVISHCDANILLVLILVAWHLPKVILEETEHWFISGEKMYCQNIKVMNGINWKLEWVFNMKIKIYRMMKRWKGLGGKLESSDKAIRRTINRQGSSYKELFSRCPSIWKTFITWEQLLGVVGVRFHCLALFKTFDLGLFKNSHKFHESIPERAFCLAILQVKMGGSDIMWSMKRSVEMKFNWYSQTSLGLACK